MKALFVDSANQQTFWIVFELFFGTQGVKKTVKLSFQIFYKIECPKLALKLLILYIYVYWPRFDGCKFLFL